MPLVCQPPTPKPQLDEPDIAAPPPDSAALESSVETVAAAPAADDARPSGAGEFPPTGSHEAHDVDSAALPLEPPRRIPGSLLRRV